MVSLTLSISDEFKSKLKSHSWINWSEVAREEIIKKLIFENYIKTGKISDSEWAFCEKIDWHPVDFLPIKKEFARKYHENLRQKSIKLNSINDIFR
jgi:hypothetical protein